MIKTVLFWDIDGTLLTTARAGIAAWEDSFAALSGRQLSLDKYPTAGLTDIEIAVKLLKEFGTFSQENVLSLLTGYEDRLATYLHRRQGQVFPGVVEVLTQLQTFDHVHSLLLTGNTARGASAKLTHYGLNQFFSHGAFSDGLADRPSIAHRALRMAKESLMLDQQAEFYVIGDTPHDIHCANAIGAKTIAVCTGGYTFEQLVSYQPWFLMESLANVNLFFNKIGLNISTEQ